MPIIPDYGRRKRSRTRVVLYVLAVAVCIGALAGGAHVWKLERDREEYLAARRVTIERHARLNQLAKQVEAAIQKRQVTSAAAAARVSWQEELEAQNRPKRPFRVVLIFDAPAKAPRVRIADLASPPGRQYWFWEGEVIFNPAKDAIAASQPANRYEVEIEY